MHVEIERYVRGIIFPLIASAYPLVAEEMTVEVRGGFCLGLSTDPADWEVIIWLDERLWEAYGGQVQLALTHHLPSFDLGSRGAAYPTINVWPLRWLGCCTRFLERRRDPPWEKVPIEKLFELQESLLLRDPRGILGRLRMATAPERFPKWLWQKQLIVTLNQFDEELAEYRHAVSQGQVLEAQLVLGDALETLLHLGFLIHHRYYPVRRSLRAAFERLSDLSAEVLPHLDIALRSTEGAPRIRAMEVIRATYTEYIKQTGVLSPGILANLLWAERCQAWANPNWREGVECCEQRALEAGHAGSGWVWRLWGWS